MVLQLELSQFAEVNSFQLLLVVIANYAFVDFAITIIAFNMNVNHTNCIIIAAIIIYIAVKSSN